MKMAAILASGVLALACATAARAEGTTSSPPPTYDAALASRLGADELGMRGYVFVVLKTGPNRMPDGPARDAMFQGHFANIQRLAKEGKLVVAGPFDGVDGWRGMFVFAGSDIEAVKQDVGTDPVIKSGEMVAEYHKLYSSAAMMLVGEVHEKIKQRDP
jgi:uncharacterized protein YciI